MFCKWGGGVNSFSYLRIHMLGKYGKKNILGYLGHFGTPWRPLMAISDPENGSHTLSRMWPALIQPWSTLIQQFGAPKGYLWHQEGHFGLFGSFRDPMAPPYGHFGPGKWFPGIVPDVTRLDPTLIHSDPAVWGSQGDLWHQEGHFGLFGSFRGHKMGENGFSKLGILWISPLLNPSDQMNALVLLK